MVRSSLAVALTASLALLFASPALGDDPDGTARYDYKVTGVDFDASADLAAVRDPGDCVANYTAGWAGHLTSIAEDSELSPLTFGKGSLKIGNHGTTGKVTAELALVNDFSDAFHLLETVCDNLSTTEVDEGEEKLTPCSESGVESDVTISLKINGGVGNQVKLTWKFVQGDGGAGFLVLNYFRCGGELFEWGQSPTCTSNAVLNTFTSKSVTLPFNCLYQTTTPPASSYYTSYAEYAYGNGALRLKRTKQSLTKGGVAAD